MAFIDSGKNFDKEKNHVDLTKKMKGGETIQYPLRIPKSTYKRLKIQLANDEKRLIDVLLNLIEKYINKEINISC